MLLFRRRLAALLMALGVALGFVLSMAPAASAATYPTISYRCNPAHGAGMSVQSNGTWYSFYPCTTRYNTSTMRVWAHSCVVWRYYSSTYMHRSCNSGTGSYYVTVTSDTYVDDVFKT